MNTQFIIQVISGNSAAAIDGIIGGMNKAAGATDGLNSAIDKVGKTAFSLNNISTALSSVTNELDRAVEPGIKFDDQMHDLQAITGATEGQMKAISEAARDQAKAFGIDASGGVESYKMFLSKLSPELAKTPAALGEMGRYAAVLSKQMANDVGGATDLLTTAMNQYGISTDDPIAATRTMGTMMNIMSAAAQQGSAEMPQIKAALEQSGMMAKTANVSFAELNATIQVLDKAGKKGAEGGVAVRNMLAELSQGAMNSPKTIAMLQAAGIPIDALADKSKSFSQRLELLKPIMNDTAAMTQLFGKENVSAGMALVQNTSEIDRLTGKITGTNSAVEMADIKMGSFAEQMARAKAWVSDFGISLFNGTKPFLPFITFGMGALQVMANLGQATNLFSAIAKSRMITAIGSSIVSMGSWIATTTMAALAQLGLNAAMYANPIGMMVLGIAAAIGAIVVLVKYWDNITAAVSAFGKWVLEHNPFSFLIDLVSNIFPGFRAAWDGLWNWLKGKFDMLVGWLKTAFGWIKSLFSSDTTKEATKEALQDFADQMKSAAPVVGVEVQGLANTNTPLAGYDPNEKKKKKVGQELSSNISAGGQRPTTINQRIDKLIGIGELRTINMKDGATAAGRTVVEELLMALQSVNGKLSVQ